MLRPVVLPGGLEEDGYLLDFRRNARLNCPICDGGGILIDPLREGAAFIKCVCNPLSSLHQMFKTGKLIPPDFQDVIDRYKTFHANLRESA
jgi:hypothetical protein